MTVDECLANPQVLRSLYGHVPELRGVRVRSVNLNWRGPTLTLRVDMPAYPRVPPQEWADAGLDTVQCQLQFLAVEHLSLESWSPPVVGDVEMVSLGHERRMRVTVDGRGTALRFDCAESVRVGHISAFRIGADGSDDGRHFFMSVIDARRYDALPGTEEKTFYER
ncbi:Imm50 family immunity protein [Streptomyces sp. NPDC052687]|uniref:Imm50 family immunity protein n=1 Tax=Streptomyces sp. NPDC052687 TaxID=3154759 RepID=UPI00342753A9